MIIFSPDRLQKTILWPRVFFINVASGFAADLIAIHEALCEIISSDCESFMKASKFTKFCTCLLRQALDPFQPARHEQEPVWVWPNRMNVADICQWHWNTMSNLRTSWIMLIFSISTSESYKKKHIFGLFSDFVSHFDPRKLLPLGQNISILKSPKFCWAACKAISIAWTPFSSPLATGQVLFRALSWRFTAMHQPSSHGKLTVKSLCLSHIDIPLNEIVD